MFKVGDRVGEYEIAARLKAGGMATLFLGRRAGATGFSRHVAIKVVHGHLAGDQTFVRMFLDEALLSARIHHPNVVHVEELGEADGTYFLVMEYVHGCALNQLLRALAKNKRKLSPEMAVWIAIQVADGLHAAHEVTGEDGQLLGVVHRDVSPQNVLLAYKGHVKLIDFGIAKARGRAQQTATGASIKGKLRYMSPEQAFGRAVDRTTDVYALAIVLWEMLTMRKMFDADNDFALLDMVRAPTIAPPSTLSAGIPEALDRALLNALSADPALRPTSAKEFRRRLAEAVPAAAALDSDSLGELLATMMSDDLEKERRALPESLSGFPSQRLLQQAMRPVLPQSQDEGEEIVHTVALDMSDLRFFDDGSGSSEAGQSDDEAQGMDAIAQMKSFKRVTTTTGSQVQRNAHTEKLQRVTDTDAAAVIERRVPDRAVASPGVLIGAAVVLVGLAAGVGGFVARNSGSRNNAAAVTSQPAHTTISTPSPDPTPPPRIVVPAAAIAITDAGPSLANIVAAADAGVAHTATIASASADRQVMHRVRHDPTQVAHPSGNAGNGSAGTTHTRMLNGVPIVQDDF